MARCAFVVVFVVAVVVVVGGVVAICYRLCVCVCVSCQPPGMDHMEHRVPVVSDPDEVLILLQT